MFSNSAPALATRLEQMEKEKKQREHQLASLEQSLARQKKEALDVQRHFEEIQRKNNELLEVNNRQDKMLKRLKDDYVQIDYKRQNIEQQLSQKELKLKAENQENCRLQTSTLDILLACDDNRVEIVKMQEMIEKLEREKITWDAEKLRLENRATFLEGTRNHNEVTRHVDSTTTKNLNELQESLRMEKEKFANLLKENEELKAERRSNLIGSRPAPTGQQRNDLERQISEMRDILASTEKENTTLKLETSKLKKEVCNLENEKLASAKQYEKTSRNNLATFEQALDEKEHEIIDIKQALEKSRQEILKKNETYHSEKMKLEGDIERLSHENKKIISDLSSLQQLISEKEVTITSLNADIHNLRNEVRQRDTALVEAIEIREMALLNLRSELENLKTVSDDGETPNDMQQYLQTASQSTAVPVEESPCVLSEQKQNLQNLQDQISQQNVEISRLLEYSGKLESDAKELNAQKEKFETEKVLLEDKLQKVALENNALKTQLEELQVKMNDNEHIMQAKNEEIESLKREINHMSHQLKGQNETIKKLEDATATISELLLKIDDAHKLIDEKEQIIQQLQFNIELGTDTISDLQEQLDNMKLILDERSAEIKDLTIKCCNLVSNNTTLESRCSTLESDLEILRQNETELARQHEVHSHIISELRKQIAESIAQKAKMIEKLQIVNEEKDKLEEKISNAEQKLVTLSSIYDSTRQNLEEVQAKLTITSDLNNVQEKKLNDANSETVKLKKEISDLEASHKADVQRFESILLNYEQRSASLNENLLSCKDELDSRIKANKKLLLDFENLQMQMSNQEKCLNTLKQANDENEHALKLKESTICMLHEEMEILKSQVDKHLSDNDINETRIRNLLTSNEQLTRQTETLTQTLKKVQSDSEQQISDFKRQLEDATLEQMRLAQELEDAKNSLATKQAQSQLDDEVLNDLNDQITTLQKSLDQLNNEKKALQSSLDDLHRLCENEKQLVGERDTELKNMKEILMNREQTIAEMQTKIDIFSNDQEESRQLYEKRAQDLQEQLDGASTEKIELTSQLEQLHIDLENLNRNLNDAIENMLHKETDLEQLRQSYEAKQKELEALQLEVKDLRGKNLDHDCLVPTVQELNDEVARMRSLIEQKDEVIRLKELNIDESLNQLQALNEKNTALEKERNELSVKLEDADKAQQILLADKSLAMSRCETHVQNLKKASELEEQLRQDLEQLQFERQNERADFEIMISEQEAASIKIADLMKSLETNALMYTELESKYAAVMSELTCRNEELSGMQEKSAGLQVQVNELVNRLNDSQDEINNLTASLNHTICEKDEQLASMTSEISEKRDIIDTLTSQIISADNRVAVLEKTLEKINTEVLHQENAELVSKNKQLGSLNRELLTNIDHLKQKCLHFEAEVKNNLLDHDKYVADSKLKIEKYETRCESLENDVHKLQTKISQADQALENKSRQISNLQNDLMLIEDRVKSQNRAIDNLQVTVNDKQGTIDELQRKLKKANEASKQSESTQTPERDIKVEAEDLRAEIESLTVRYTTLEEQFQQIVSRNVELETKSRELINSEAMKQSEIDSLTSKLADLQKTSVNERVCLEKARSDWNDQLEAIKNQLQLKEEELRLITDELAKRNFGLNLLQDEKHELIQKLEKAEEIFTSIMHEKNELLLKLDEKDKQLDMQVEESRDLQRKLNDTSANHAADFEKLQREYEVVKHNHDELYTTLKSFDDSKLNDLLTEAELKASVLESELKHIVGSYAEKEKLAASLHLTIERLEEENGTLERKLLQFKTEGESLSQQHQDEMDKIKLSLIELNDKFVEVKMNKRNAEGEIKNLLLEIKQLREDVAKADISKKNVQNDLNLLKTKTEDLQTLCDEKDLKLRDIYSQLEKNQVTAEAKTAEIVELKRQAEEKLVEIKANAEEKEVELENNIKRLEDQKKELIANANILSKKCTMIENDKEDLKILYEKRIEMLTERVKVLEETLGKKSSSHTDSMLVTSLHEQIKNLEERVKDHDELEEIYLKCRSERDSFQRRYEMLRMKAKATETAIDDTGEIGSTSKGIFKRSLTVMKDGSSSPLTKKKVYCEKENEDDVNKKTPTKLAARRQTLIYKAPAPSVDEKVPECKQQ